MLDLMRFGAALSVVFYHYTNGDSTEAFVLLSGITKFGYLGVPLFFMISGFVISASALNRTPAEFVISRATRIYPTIIVCLTMTVLVVLTLANGQHQISIFRYLSNMLVLNEYVGEEYIDGVYWTLLAEIKFYFCIFLLITFRVFDKFKVWLAIWMLMTVTFYLFKQPFFMGWFISPEYSAFFIAGVTFFLVTKYGYDKYYSGLLITSLITGLVNAYDQVNGFVHSADQFDHIISLCLICSFFVLFVMISLDKIKITSNKVFLLLGGMTYPLYLLHSRIGEILFNRLGDYFNPFTLLIVIISLMFILSAWVHLYVERRIANHIKEYLFEQLDRFKRK